MYEAYEPQPIEALAPNLNSWTGAGKVSKIEALTGKSVGASFTLSYAKVWPNGGDETWDLRCYVSGQERAEKLKALDGQVCLLRGEVTPRGTIYCYAVDPFLSDARAGKRSTADDVPRPTGTSSTRKP